MLFIHLWLNAGTNKLLDVHHFQKLVIVLRFGIKYRKDVRIFPLIEIFFLIILFFLAAEQIEIASVFGRKGSTTTPPNRQIFPSSSTYHSLERSGTFKDDSWNIDYSKMDHHSLDRDNNLNRGQSCNSKSSYFQNIPSNFPRNALNSSHSNISNESNEKTLVNQRSGSGRFSTNPNPRFDKTPNDQKYTISCSSNNLSSNNIIEKIHETEIDERITEQVDKN